MKFVKYLAWIIVGLFVLVPTILTALLATNAGSKLLLDQGARIAEVQLSYSDIQGNLISSLEVSNLAIDYGALHLSADTIKVAWQPLELLDSRLVFKEVVTSHINFVSSDSGSTSTSEAFTLPQLKLPLHLIVKSYESTDTVWVMNNSSHKLPDFSGSLSWHGDQLELSQLNIQYENIQAQITAQVTTSGSYPVAAEVNWSVEDPIKQSELHQVSGESIINGDTHHLNVENRFLVGGELPLQKIDAQFKSLLSTPQWLAEVELTDFPLRPMLPLALPSDSDWFTWLSEATTSIQATVDNNQAILKQLTVNNLGPLNGDLQAQGLVTNYLAALEQPDAATFNLDIASERLQLPSEVTSLSIVIDTLQSNITGSLARFDHQLNVSAHYDDNQPLRLTTSGDGSLNHLNLNSAAIDSELLTADFAAQINWQNELSASLSIESLTATPTQLAQYDDNKVTAHGALTYHNGRVEAQQLELKWLNNHAELNGDMTEATPLVVALKLPQLDKLYESDYLAGDLAAVITVSGAIDETLTINIDDFVLNHPDFGSWETNRPGSVHIPVGQPLAFKVSDFCLASNEARFPAEICLASSAENTAQTTKIDAKNLPLSLLNRFRSSDVAERIWGLANLKSTITYDTATWELVDTQGEIRSERTILFALDEEIRTRFNYWQMSWRGNTQSVTAELTAELEDQQGLLIGDIVVESPLAEANLNGDIVLELRDLTILQWVLPDMRYEEAHALALITIEGRASAPEITGSVELAAKEIGFAQSGLLLTDVRIAAADTPNQPGSITLDGQAQSGEGWISITGDIQPLDTALNIDIKGEKFRAVQLPTVTVDVSPNINILVKDKRIDITGEVLIPYAVIDQPELTEVAVTPSGDVEVYDDGVRVSEQSESLYPLYADVRVTLGDTIKVTGFGFEGELAGSLRVRETPTRALTATGGVSVSKGFYELYGQRLEIDRGSLIYNGGPIDNPGLDLRVNRAQENMTSTERVTVGAQISGTLLEPKFTLYSTPAMPDSEVLSYLILGRGSGEQNRGNNNMQLQALILLGSKGTDLLGESLQSTFGFDEFGIDSTMNPNDTSFYVGKYLSPKLYVKYGVGLFENTNTFLIRYLLSEKIIIETTASGEAQGGDIFYTIEK